MAKNESLEKPWNLLQIRKPEEKFQKSMENLPRNAYQMEYFQLIGDDVFVFASTYYDSVSVHIRRFKKYGKTYYPTPEGITLDGITLEIPRWIKCIMRKKKVPESLEELPSGLSLLNDTFK
ncbi:hypothetical protein TNCV_3425771 [Trichonephila clavipes]|nr:hypothetical protein TNCV_3425771 [Trichonephila clavipes]